MPPEDDLCDACGYHLILRKVLDLEGVHRPDTSTGLERLIKRQLSEGTTLESALFWAKIVAVFFLLLLCVLVFGRYGLPVAALAIAAYVVVSRWLAARRQVSSAAGSCGPLSAAVWSGVLFTQRAIGWRLPTWPFPKVRVLEIRDPAFDDEDLADLDLDGLQALDIEGTRVSDDGLACLADGRQLRFLVLRRTQVTPAGVVRLQAALPEAWIWH